MFSKPFHPKIGLCVWVACAAIILLLSACVSTPMTQVGPAKKSVFLKNSYSKHLVVFVHGINGDPVASWTHGEGSGSFYWPEGLVSDSTYNRAEVLSFGYESDCGSSFDLKTVGRQLADTINELQEQKNYKTISFVAHSTGGWVVRDYILGHHSDLIREVPVENIITLGTPGLNRNMQRIAAFVCGNKSGDFSKAGGDLEALNERWRQRFLFSGNGGTFLHSAGYELVPTQSLGKIVHQDSAVYLSHTVQALMKSHVQLAMPNGRDDPVYIWVRQQLLRFAPDPRLRQYADAETIRIEEVIRLLQAELQGTDLQPVLSFLDHGDLDEALAFVYARESEGDLAALARDFFVKGQIHEVKLDYRNALANYRNALQLAPENHEYLKEAGVLSLILGDYESATQYFKKASDGDLKTLGSNHPDIAAHWNNLGDAARKQGDNVRAIEYYQKARESFTATIGADHPLMSQINSHLGSVQYRNGDFDGAIESWEKAVEGDLRNWGEDHPNLARNFNHLGSAWMAKGEVDKAIAYYEKAMQSDIKNFGPDHADVAMGWSQLADAAREKGDLDKAVEYYEKAVKGFIASYGPDHPNVAVQWNHLGSVWRSKGDYDRGIQYYEQALASNRKNLGSDHPHVARDLNNLGAAWSSKRDYDRAIPYFEEARNIFKQQGMMQSQKKVETNLNTARKNKSLKNPIYASP